MHPKQPLMRFATHSLFGAIAIAVTAMPLAADPTTTRNKACAPHAAVVEKLARDYGESRQSIGLGRDNAMMEVFASRDTGSWTITVTRADGITCLIASGQAFEVYSEAVIEPGSAL